MMPNQVDINGMPYFPGVAVGKLHRGIDGINANSIALIRHDVITSFATLPAGIIVMEAAPFSHKMIALLETGLPTVIITAQQAALLREGVTLCINGVNGHVTDNIIEGTETGTAIAEHRKQLSKGQSLLLADGGAVNLYASVRRPAATRNAVELGASAIGLVRSEFLLPEDGHIPDAAFYQRAFRTLCDAATPLSVTFRLLDIAADKLPAWLPSTGAVGQILGLQGVRLFSIDPVATVIEAQLAALCELSTEFNLRLLVPYIVRLEEFEYWRKRIRKRIPEHVPVGAMAETPASVLDISRLLDCADFIAIGCNDLMQSLYAADRDQAELRYYMDPYAPVLFRLFRQIAEQAANNLHRIQLCGVLPQIQGILPVLLGLGYRTFSVDAPFIPYLAKIIVDHTQSDCEMLATQVCNARTTQDVLAILELPIAGHTPFLNHSPLN